MQNLQKVDRQVLPDRLEEYLAVIERNQRQILKLLLGKTVFAVSLLFMLGSLAISLQEILISMQALNLELSDMQN